MIFTLQIILAEAFEKNEDPGFQCKKCTQYFSTGAELAAHQDAKYKEKVELCTTCDKRFTKKAYLHEH